MKRHARGTIHRVADSLFCLRYQPPPEFQLPLAVIHPKRAVLHSWCILPAEPEEVPVYLAVIRMLQPFQSGGAFPGTTVEIDTQFGPCEISLSGEEAFSAMPDPLRREALALIFCHLAELDPVFAQSIITELPADLTAGAFAEPPSITARMSRAGRLVIAISHAATAVLVRASANLLYLPLRTQRLVETVDGFHLECDMDRTSVSPAVTALSLVGIVWPGGFQGLDMEAVAADD